MAKPLDPSRFYRKGDEPQRFPAPLRDVYASWQAFEQATEEHRTLDSIAMVAEALMRLEAVWLEIADDPVAAEYAMNLLDSCGRAMVFLDRVKLSGGTATRVRASARARYDRLHMASMFATGNA